MEESDSFIGLQSLQLACVVSLAAGFCIQSDGSWTEVRGAPLWL